MVLFSDVFVCLTLLSRSLPHQQKCALRCHEDSSECPAFAVDYVLGRCFQLDRNTQGRNTDIISSPGKSYFEKICVRGEGSTRQAGDLSRGPTLVLF